MVQLVVTLILFVMLSVLAFWKEAAVPFMVAGAVGLATAFYWYDTYTNTFGMAVSLALVALSLYYMATAFRSMYGRRSGEKDE